MYKIFLINTNYNVSAELINNLLIDHFNYKSKNIRSATPMPYGIEIVKEINKKRCSVADLGKDIARINGY